MNIEELRTYCLSKNAVEEDLPFGPDTLVFKVVGKMFLLCGLDEVELKFNVKCAPGLALELREEFPCVQPGYHMSKIHWNTIIVDGSVSDSKLKEWIDHSYNEVVAHLPKIIRDTLNK